MFHLKEIIYKNILDINELEVPGNKITCIVGESGSGKTTLLKLLNQMISADRGEISYKGTNIDRIPPVELRRKVVMLSQIPIFFAGTVKDNLLTGLKFSEKAPASDQELTEALRLVKLDKGLTENAEKLSGGEKQRLALARILLLQPEVLLLDEPSSALDDETAHIVIDRLVRYTKENGKTMIMVTHSKEIARNFAENMIEIKSGKVIKHGGDSVE